MGKLSPVAGVVGEGARVEQAVFPCRAGRFWSQRQVKVRAGGGGYVGRCGTGRDTCPLYRPSCITTSSLSLSPRPLVYLSFL